MPHCYDVLKDDEKWKKHDDLDLSNKRKRTIELDEEEVEEEEDDASSDDGK